MAERRNRYREALRSRDLRLLLTSFIIDESGGWIGAVVLSAYVFGRTGSPTWVAIIYAVRLLVGLVASAPAGVIADRYDRRRVIQVQALLCAVITGGLAFCVAENAPLWTLLILAASISALVTVNRPASGALLPDLVDERDLSAANSLLAILENVVVVVGPAIGGLVLLSGDPAWGIGIDAVTYLASLALFGVIGKASRGNAEPGEGMARQFAAGLRVLRQHRVAFVLVLLIVLDSAVFGAATAYFGPLSEHLGTGANGYSYLIGAEAFGGVLGALAADRVAARPRLAPVILGGFLTECIPVALLTTTQLPVVASVLQAISGAGMVAIDVVGMTALQRDLPRETLGRATAIMFGLISGGSAALSLIASGLLGSVGLTATTVIFGLGFPLLALLGLPAVRRNDHETAAAVARLEPRVELLRDLDLFTGAGRQVLERLAQSAEQERVSFGTVVIRQGDPPDALWVLTEGTLAVEVDEDGRTLERPPVQAPGYVGEIGLLRGIPRTATVTAATDCTLLRLTGEDFLGALETAPPSRSLLTISGERLSRTGSAPVGA